MKIFNIFQVAGIWKSEEIHTRVISELLNPNSQFHDMGSVFLQKFLDKLGLNDSDKLRLDGDLTKAEDITVETEVATDNGRRIDMVISTPNYYLPFEVKIWARDQKSQLHDYYHYACSEAQKLGKKAPYIYYLTPDGHDPSDWSLGGADDELQVFTLSFQKDILSWLDDCIKSTNQIPPDVLEIMKQLRDNIHREDIYRPGRDLGFYLWQGDILDDIYQDLAQHYALPWTECTDQYMTCTLHKKDKLEFALRIQKEDEDSVTLHLICGLAQGDEKPDYTLAGPYIHGHPQEYEHLLLETFSNQENVSESTAKSTWDRMKVVDYKRQEETCLEKIEEVFSWLRDGIKEKRKRS